MRTPWLDDRRGYLSDWVTQRWVRTTGRSVDLESHPWLAGPVGKPAGIGGTFYHDLARETGLAVRPGRGLLPDFGALAGPRFDPRKVHPQVGLFYERTADYALDAWAEWCGAFRPFGRLLAALFSRRLEQLNVPLSPLDTSRGVTSEVLALVDPRGDVRHTAWVRRLRQSGRVLYAGTYSTTALPGHEGPCVKVVFPLPNGNAIVVMAPEAHEDGSFSITSAGRRFGDPGFYFTVHVGGRVHARYVRSMRERIRVYAAEPGVTRADHDLTLLRLTFLRIHYRLEPRRAPETAGV